VAETDRQRLIPGRCPAVSRLFWPYDQSAHKSIFDNAHTAFQGVSETAVRVPRISPRKSDRQSHSWYHFLCNAREPLFLSFRIAPNV